MAPPSKTRREADGGWHDFKHVGTASLWTGTAQHVQKQELAFWQSLAPPYQLPVQTWHKHFTCWGTWWSSLSWLLLHKDLSSQNSFLLTASTQTASTGAVTPKLLISVSHSTGKHTGVAVPCIEDLRHHTCHRVDLKALLFFFFFVGAFWGGGLWSPPRSSECLWRLCSAQGRRQAIFSPSDFLYE